MFMISGSKSCSQNQYLVFGLISSLIQYDQKCMTWKAELRRTILRLVRRNSTQLQNSMKKKMDQIFGRDKALVFSTKIAAMKLLIM